MPFTLSYARETPATEIQRREGNTFSCLLKCLPLFAGLSFCALYICLCFSPAHAATRTLTLEQALAITAENHRDIQKAKEYRQQVEGRYVEERAAALPQLALKGTVSRDQDTSQRAFFGGGNFPTKRDYRSIEISVTQPLFTWGKVGAAIRAASVGLKTADDQLRLARQSAQRDVATVFYDILLARELHATARQNLEQKKRHLEEARRKYAAGVATDYDILAAEVAVANAGPEVIRTENRVRAMRDRLRFYLALREDDADAEGSLEAATVSPVSYQQAIATAVRSRPELADLNHRLGVAQELVNIANAADKPRLDLQGGYGWRDLEMGSARADGPAWSAGLYLSYPFLDGLRTRGKVTQAESDLRSLRIEADKLRDAIALETRMAVNAVQEAEQLLLALSGTVTQAEQLLSMAEKGYTLGVKIRLEVDDAEFNLLQARTNLARARRDLLVARIDLHRAMGVLGE